MPPSLPTRKTLHLEVCAHDEVGFKMQTTLLEQVHLQHDAVAPLAWDELQTECSLFAVSLRAPLLIGAMTGGTAEAGALNRALAQIAEELGIGFALGSQKAMHKLPECADSFEVRRHAPTTLVLANLGAVYAHELGPEATRQLAAHVGANALNLHLNPAMELVQGRGDRDFRHVLEALSETHCSDMPVIAKETGAGISAVAARALRTHGIRHVDVSGAGGTSWTAVESQLAAHDGDDASAQVGQTFRDWGIPTGPSVVHAARAGFETVIASGGIASGLDVARALALGAHAAGIARPVLLAFRAGGEAGARAYLQRVLRELRMAMLLTGCRTLDDLRRCPRVLGAELERWCGAEPA